MSANISAQRKDRCQVGLKYFVPVLVRKLVRSMSALNAAAVEQNIDLVSICYDFGDNLLYGILR